MFAKTIIDSDAFLDMPQSTQLLYFHLSMRADDDGFINKPKAIMNMVGCKDDDIKILIAKKFIIPFESGIVVIKHWKIHNYIRNDRYIETKYKGEKSELTLDENNAYHALATDGIPSDNQMDTQVRLGKVRVGKVNTIAQMFIDFWSVYPKKKSKGDAEKAWKVIKPNADLLAKILVSIEQSKKSTDWLKEDGKYIPYPATWLRAKGWEDETTPPTSTTPDYSKSKDFFGE